MVLLQNPSPVRFHLPLTTKGNNSVRKIIPIALSLFLVISTIAQSFAHSGGTDSNGCHAGSQPYHCHNSKSGFGEYEDALTIVSVIVVGLVVIYFISSCMNRMRAYSNLQDMGEDSHIDDFETYAKFDSETEEFQTGIRYKIQW